MDIVYSCCNEMHVNCTAIRCMRNNINNNNGYIFRFYYNANRINVIINCSFDGVSFFNPTRLSLVYSTLLCPVIMKSKWYRVHLVIMKSCLFIMSYNDRILAIIVIMIIVIIITILWFWEPKVLAQLECVILFSDFEDFCCYNFTSIIHVGTIDCVHLWVYSDPMISWSSVLCVINFNNQVMATPVIFSQNPHCATKIRWYGTNENYPLQCHTQHVYSLWNVCVSLCLMHWCNTM